MQEIIESVRKLIDKMDAERWTLTEAAQAIQIRQSLVAALSDAKILQEFLECRAVE